MGKIGQGVPAVIPVERIPIDKPNAGLLSLADHDAPRALPRPPDEVIHTVRPGMQALGRGSVRGQPVG